MKFIKLFSLMLIICSGLFTHAQVLVASNKANLRVFVNLNSGEEVVIESKSLDITYEPGAMMKGTLPLGTLSSTNETIMMLLDSISGEMLRFEVQLPGNDLIFGNALNQKFSAEAVFLYGEQEGRAMMNFEANRKNVKNVRVYQISAMGTMSLSEHFGYSSNQFIDDNFRYQFFQNVEVRKY